MKTPSFNNRSLLALTLIAAIAARGSAMADPMRPELPTRTPGLWRITTISAEVGMQTNEVCITDSDSIIGPQRADCAKPSITHTGDQIIVTLECGDADRRSVESLLFTGDFKSWYRAQSKMTSGGLRAGFTIDAKFIRPDCQD